MREIILLTHKTGVSFTPFQVSSAAAPCVSSATSVAIFTVATVENVSEIA